METAKTKNDDVKAESGPQATRKSLPAATVGDDRRRTMFDGEKKENEEAAEDPENEGDAEDEVEADENADEDDSDGDVADEEQEEEHDPDSDKDKA